MSRDYLNGVKNTLSWKVAVFLISPESSRVQFSNASGISNALCSSLAYCSLELCCCCMCKNGRLDDHEASTEREEMEDLTRH